MQSGDPVFEHLLIDSRKLTTPETSLFFAIPGDRHDGHRFMTELYGKGVRQFVVQTPFPNMITQLPGASIILVNSSVAALQAIAAHHRKQFTFPIIGITGSNGKTIVKEWLAALLEKDFRVVKSPKSYNSQVGVPLSVWEMNEAHTLGVFEAGISRPGEMERLEKIIQPSVGIFTNIGPAHDEGFANREQKIQEKAALFRHCGQVIYCRDHQGIGDILTKELPPTVQLCGWSWRQPGSFTPLSVKKENRQTCLQFHLSGQPVSLTLPFTDDASLENAMHCLVTALLLGVNPAELQARIALLQPVSMRLELKEGIRNCYLVDDTYNNDLAGLSIALDFLNGQGIQKKKTLILSDVLESGVGEKELYSRIARLVRSKGIGRVVGVGEVMVRNRHFFGEIGSETQFFDTTEALLNRLPAFDNELILVKGARPFRFERIIKRLQRKTHGTVLEINLESLASNLNYFRSKLQPGTKVMAMVKAFAYGSGTEIANLLQFQRVDYLAVAYADEGAALREKGIILPIMVMNPAPETFDQLLQSELEPEMYSFRILQSFRDYLQRTEQTAAIHLKLETGMNRLGFAEAELPALTQLLKDSPYIKVASLFSHLAASDELQWKDFTLEQIHRFEGMSQTLVEALGYRPIRHILNSAGITHFTPYQFDMVRLGIGLYGVGVNPAEQANLATVGTLKTTISQIKQIPAGNSVGYGRRGKASQDTTIGTIAIGYADGFDRRFSNGNGQVWVNGSLAPVIGNVCMDMTMIDITGISAHEGDEVIIFGPQLPLSELASRAGTIPYEIITGISERVKRVFYSS